MWARPHIGQVLVPDKWVRGPGKSPVIEQAFAHRWSHYHYSSEPDSSDAWPGLPHCGPCTSYISKGWNELKQAGTSLERCFFLTDTVVSGNWALPWSREKSIVGNPHRAVDVSRLRFIEEPEANTKNCPGFSFSISSLSAPPWKKSSLFFIKPSRKASVQNFCPSPVPGTNQLA